MVISNEKLLEIIPYQGVELEIVERPVVLWVGKLAAASNLTDEPEIGRLLDEYRRLIAVEKRALINPDWDAAISIDYWKPSGTARKSLMFAKETYSREQDACYDLFEMPASLFLRLKNDGNAARLIGKTSCETYELFGFMMRTVMPQIGYAFHSNGAQEVEYCNHRLGLYYAYSPIVKV